MTPEIVTAMMLTLSPGRDHSQLAKAIASVVEAEAPLFRDDADKRKTASLLVAVGFRESSLRNDAVSKTSDYCTFQINASMGGGVALTKDPEACTRRAMAILRQSFRVCPDSPLSWYVAGGNDACTNDRARRISNDRLTLARRVLKAVEQPDAAR